MCCSGGNRGIGAVGRHAGIPHFFKTQQIGDILYANTGKSVHRYQFVCGVAFALVAIRSGSILPTVISHFFNNALIITMEKFGWSLDAIYLPFLIVSILCLISSVVYLVFFDKKGQEFEGVFPEKTEIKKSKEFFLFASVGIAVCALTWISNLLSGI